MICDLYGRVVPCILCKGSKITRSGGILRLVLSFRPKCLSLAPD
uniref:Uncharacterized protein n=1 Tax=Microviridae sp. ctX0F7 TaxID=2824999 RepID=A0A8S5NYY1_9VIRU|nr:MAG TPA: hypothetical protein [Microviridae sp. ctX0F7]DAG10613.1 MAG TPA: GRX-like domain containing protein [Microviridae sp.]